MTSDGRRHEPRGKILKPEILVRRRQVLAALGALPLARLAAATDIELQRTGWPYVPTPQVLQLA